MVLACAISASATPYSFQAITENDGTGVNGGIGEEQFAVDVSQQGPDEVLFTFSNTGVDPSSITHVYFSDSGMVRLFTISQINSGAGTAFSNPADPQDLPGGDTLVPPFETTFRDEMYFSADSDEPDTIDNGVSPGESFSIAFTLDASATYADVLLGLDLGTLRIGVVGQGFDQELNQIERDTELGWEAFINGPATSTKLQVPDMGTTVLLLGCALLALEGLRRHIAAR
jgi:hypothetical protein